MDDFYKQAEVKVTGKKPGTWITKKGKSCTYGVTMTKDAPNPDAAAAFLQYVLSPDGGLKILKNMGQPPFEPAWVPSQEMKDAVPEPVKALVEVKK
jgi:molybdate/tungstate transport system substrate-binding protein